MMQTAFSMSDPPVLALREQRGETVEVRLRPKSLFEPSSGKREVAVELRMTNRETTA